MKILNKAVLLYKKYKSILNRIDTPEIIHLYPCESLDTGVLFHNKGVTNVVNKN